MLTVYYFRGDPSVDLDPSVVFFNIYDPSITDPTRKSPCGCLSGFTPPPPEQNYTVSLLTQRAPFSSATKHEFDPTLGKHDDFLLLGRYIFAQKTDLQGVISLLISYDRNPFKKAMIAATDPHQVSLAVSAVDIYHHFLQPV